MKKRVILFIILILFGLNLISSVKVNIIFPKENNKISNFCDVDWKCLAWGKCIKGIKERVCFDKNNCESKYNKPITKTFCKEDKFREIIDSKVQFIVFGLFIIVLLLTIFFVFWLG